jgi:hypothetical protein
VPPGLVDNTSLGGSGGACDVDTVESFWFIILVNFATISGLSVTGAAELLLFVVEDGRVDDDEGGRGGGRVTCC